MIHLDSTCWILRVEGLKNPQISHHQVLESPLAVYPKKTRISPSNVTEKPEQFPASRGSNCCSQKFLHMSCWSKYVYFFLLVKYRVFLTYSTTSLAQMPIFLVQVRHHFSSSKPNVSWYFLSWCCLQNPHSFALTTSLCLLLVDYRDNYPQNANVHHFLWLNHVI